MAALSSVACLLLSCAFVNVMAMEEFVVVHAPESVRFLSSEPVHSSNLGDILSAMLAYTVPTNTDWHSLAVVSPWKRPEAVAVVELLGFGSDVDMSVDGTRFLLENAGDIDKQFDLLSRRTGERFLEKRPVLLHMDLADELQDSKIVQPLLLKSIPANPSERLAMAFNDPTIGALIKDSTFNATNESDVQLLVEVATIREFLKALRSHKSLVHDNVPDVYWLKVGGLESIVSTYGLESLQFREALRLLRQVISEVERTMRKVYDDKVVVAVMKVDDIPSSLLGYKKRKLLEVSTTPEPDLPPRLKYNLSTTWDSSFPVMFSIMAFVSIILILAVLGISVGMWHMDPGRDSIIYRASKRMKKD